MIKQRKQLPQTTSSPFSPSSNEEEAKEESRVKALLRRRATLGTTDSVVWMFLPVVATITLLVMSFRYWHSQQVNPLPLSATTKTSGNTPSIAGKDLTLQDFELDRYLGRGSVNVVCRGRIRHERVARQHGLWDDTEGKARELVIKYIDTREYGHAELESFERIMNIDTAKAQSVGLMQAVWAARDVPNPFYCPLVKSKDDEEWDEEKCLNEYGSQPGTSDMHTRTRARLRVLKTVDVMVLPYFEPRYIRDTSKTMKDDRIFFQSMLEQLAVTHEAGVNNLDLQVNRNMYVEPGTGRAIMFDWNGYLPVGAPAHDEHQNWGIAAPEAWLWRNQDVQALNMNIHAMDVWQAGIVWNNFLYKPCRWQTASVLKRHRGPLSRNFWKAIVATLGGNTIIPINATASVDVREYAGIPTSMKIKPPPPSKFRPLLRECKQKKSRYLDNPNVSIRETELAVDLLQQMLRISPADRPTARELLDHPYFRLEGSSAAKTESK